MSPARPRSPTVVVARLWHESHIFNPVSTRRENFHLGGEGSLPPQAAASTTLDGMVRTLQEAGIEVVQAVSAQAPPGGPVDHDFYLELKGQILDCLQRLKPAGVALDLHGAFATPEAPDGDGDLLDSVREMVGPHIPVVAGFDLHANITDRMLAAADVLVACKENPHSDVVEAGEQAARFLLRMLDGWRPRTAAVRVPMLATTGAGTADWPLKGAHDIARAWRGRSPDVLDISIFNAYPFQDTDDLGQVVLVVGEGESQDAPAAAREIADFLWEQRRNFRTDAVPVEQAFDRVLAEPANRPFVLSDAGDRVLGGAPGDSTYLLRHALARGAGLRGVIPVTDPEAVRAAERAGPGGRVRMSLGGSVTPGFEALELEVTVSSVADGRFVLRGAFMTGEVFDMGRTAVLDTGAGVLVLATTLPALSVDPAMFESQGIDVAGLDYVVVKSGYHFKISFQGLATPIIVDTPGLSKYEPGMFPYSRPRRIFPEADVAWTERLVNWWPERRA